MLENSPSGELEQQPVGPWVPLIKLANSSLLVPVKNEVIDKIVLRLFFFLLTSLVLAIFDQY